MTTFVLDCSDCVGHETPECDDCVVRYLVERDEERRVTLDGDELRAVQVMSEAGLVPTVRHLRAVS